MADTPPSVPAGGICDWKEKTNCPGCQTCKGDMFYGECGVAKCCHGKAFLHCGLCPDIPCAELQQAFEITLPYNAASGHHPIRADFEIQADVPAVGGMSGRHTPPPRAGHVNAPPNGQYRFSVYRHLDVGSGDVYIELVTRVNRQGELEVEQHFVNDTEQSLSFRCHLLAPDRRRQGIRGSAQAP